MNGIQGFAKKLAPILEFVGALIAAIAAVVGQLNNGKPLSATVVISAVVAALGHATSHTTGNTPTGG
jgi:hypothetical protein